MNIATIGTSGITELFISACKYAGGINIRYVYSRSIEKAEAFRLKTGAETATDNFETIACDKEIDAVYIASPNALHYEQSLYFLERGKNVFCEKPATSSAEEFSRLEKLAESKGLFYTEAIMSIHTDAFEILKKAISDAGRIYSAHLSFCQLSSKYPAFLEGLNPNIFNPEMKAGCLMDIGVYNLYLAAALFGMPEKIQSSAKFLSSGADACGNAILEYPSFTVTLTYSKVAQGFSQSEIFGDRHTVAISSVSQLCGIDIITKQGKTNLVPEDLTRDEVMGCEAAFLRDLLNGEDKAKKKYRFANDTALIVRQMCDIIRKQNNFPF